MGFDFQVVTSYANLEQNLLFPILLYSNEVTNTHFLGLRYETNMMPVPSVFSTLPSPIHPPYKGGSAESWGDLILFAS